MHPILQYISISAMTSDAQSPYTPVWGQVQLCHISLEEGNVVVVPVALPVLFHKVLHEIHGGHVGRPFQQMAGVSTVCTQVYMSQSCILEIRKLEIENACSITMY